MNTHTKKIFRSRFVSIGVGTVVVVAGILFANSTLHRDDDMTALLAQYGEGLKGLRDSQADEQTRQQYYQVWLSTLLGEYRRLPPNTVSYDARFTCLTLADALHDYALAESLANDGLAYSTNWWDQLQYWDVRVSLRQAIANKTKDPNDIASIGVVAREALAAIRPTLHMARYSEDSISALRVQRIFRVACSIAAADDDYVQAVSLMEETGDFAAALPEALLQNLGQPWWADQCYQEAAKYKMILGDNAGAVQELDKINSLLVKRTSAGDHALIASGNSTSQDFHSDFANLWLEHATPWGPSEVRLAYALAFYLSQTPRISHDRQQLEQAVELLETALSDDAALTQADAIVSADLLESGKPRSKWILAPIRSNILTALATTYEALGLDEESKRVARVVVSDYPVHPNISYMQWILTK